MAPSVQQKGAGSLWLNTVGRRTHPARPAAGFPFHIAEIYERSHAMSTQTEHLGLHQWETTDSFLREDFNEDNRKIDEAVAEAAQTVKLYEFVSKSSGREIQADLSGIDWDAFQRYEIYITGMGNSQKCGVSVSFNGCVGESDYCVEGSSGIRTYRSCIVYLTMQPDRQEGGYMVLFGGVTGVSGYYQNIGGASTEGYRIMMAAETGVTMSGLKQMTLTADSGKYMAAGVKIIIYGTGKRA